MEASGTDANHLNSPAPEVNTRIPDDESQSVTE